MNDFMSVVGKCTSLSFKMIWMTSHLISNTSYIQFFLRVTFSSDSSPVSLDKWVFLANSLDLMKHMTLYQPKTILSLPCWKRLSPKEYNLFNFH